MLKNTFQFSFVTKFVAFLYLFFVVKLHLKGFQVLHWNFETILGILFGLISIISLSRAIGLLTRKFRFLKSFSGFFLILVVLITNFYQVSTKLPIDFSVMIENAGLATNENSLGVILNIFRKKDIKLSIFILTLLLFLEFKYKKLSTFPNIKWPKVQFVSCLGIYIFFLFLTPSSFEKITEFNQQIINYYTNDDSAYLSQTKKEFPYLNFFNSKVSIKEKPHIFVVMIESFNANFVNNKSPDGKVYTPFYNSLIKKGLFFENFWGHSIQTSKGQIGILCSILPLSSRKVFTDFPDTNLNCISDILKKEQYETLFFKAFCCIDFDNTHEFVSKNGFDHIHGMTGQFISPEESKKFTWGWGVQDNIFYSKFFEYLDKEHKKNPSKKFFSALTSVSNHQTFIYAPKDQRFIYPDQGENIKKAYANTLYLSDKYLRTFMSELEKRDYLKNSIIIITGDHSYPVGEHGNLYAHSGFHSENFKTPLLLLWPEKIKPRIETRAYSQVDIAPSIMDLIGVSGQTHFIGTSFFRQPKEFIHFIQPYDGTYLGVLKWPYRYMFHKKTRKEYLYNLEKDPKETVNIIKRYKDTDLHTQLKSERDKIFLNDLLVKENRIWKQDPS